MAALLSDDPTLLEIADYKKRPRRNRLAGLGSNSEPAEFQEIGTCDNFKRSPQKLRQKESEMATFDDNEMQPGDASSKSTAGENAPMWLIGGVAVLLVLGVAGYGFGGLSHKAPAPDQPAIQHTTQPPAPTALPPEPATTPKP
jgi:hypothetical protein